MSSFPLTCPGNLWLVYTVKNYRIFLFPLLCILFQFTLASVSSWHKSRTFDEPNHLRYGRQILCKHDVTRFDNSKMPVSVINALAEKVTDKLIPHADYRLKRYLSRMPTIFLGTLIIPVVFFWSRSLFGTRAGMAGALIATFDPGILAHERLITTDIAVTLFSFCTLWLLDAYFRAGKRRLLARASVGCGFALLSKYSALFFFVSAIILICLHHLPKTVRLLRPKVSVSGFFHCFTDVLLWVLIVFTVVWIGYGFSGFGDRLGDVAWKTDAMKKMARLHSTEFLPLPGPYLEGLDWCRFDDQRPIEGYFLGKNSTKPNRLYFFLVTLIKTPLALLMLWGMAAFYVFRDSSLLRRLQTLLLPGIFYFSVTAFLLRTQIGLRYLLPFFPFMHVFSTVCFSGKTKPWMHRVGFALIAWQTVSVLSFFPHFLPYCNELVGDRKNLFYYTADSNIDWGQDTEYLHQAIPRYFGAPFSLAPAKPVPGLVCVRADDLTGILAPRRRYRWLMDNYRPVDSIGYSYLIFRVPFRDIARFRTVLFPAAASIYPEKRVPGIREEVAAPFSGRVHVRKIQSFPGFQAHNNAKIQPNTRFRWTAVLKINAPGTYVVGTESDGYSEISINGKSIVSDSKSHPLCFRCAVIYLQKPFYSLEVKHTFKGGPGFFRFHFQPVDIPPETAEISYFYPAEYD